MSKPIIRIHDLATGEVVDREMTDAEFAQAKKDDKNAAIIEAEAEAKATAKAALFSKLGITAEEAALLLS
jgi:hypothetical protein